LVSIISITKIKYLLW